MSDARPFDMPPESAGFDARAGWLMARLMAEPALVLSNPIHAAAIIGNFGGESGLDPNINEKVPLVAGSRGGFGWEQATGSRRVALEKWAASHNLDAGSDEANYGFLLWELVDNPLIRGDGTEVHALAQLRKTTTIEAAVFTFEVLFERPSDPEGGVSSRVAFARRALAAAGHAVPPIQPIVPPPVAEPDLDNTLIDSLIRALQAALALDGLYDGKMDGVPGPKTYQAMIDYAAQRGLE